MFEGNGYLLRIFIGEADKHHGIPLYEWIVREAKNKGIAGATVFRGIAGYGSHSRIHSAKYLDLSADLPMVIEIVDEVEKLEAFLPVLDEAISEGVGTLQPVSLRFYRPKK
ncbi:MAG: DUF190 domain-containing protein [Cyanobacteria bacterium]|nr:DUF190 domain-containing protein [Cyanobacteriota bacterium]